VYLTAFEYLGCRAEVFDSAVGAAADDCLIDGDLADFGDGFRVFRQMRKRNGRLDGGKIDFVRCGIFRVRVRLIDLPVGAAVFFCILRGLVVIFKDAVFAPARWPYSPYRGGLPS
jgi:hypothetical protein